MNATAIRFHCPGCQARIKAPVQMAGQTQHCPGCGRRFIVPGPRHEGRGPILVLVESDSGCRLGVAYRRSA